jgi:acyl-ACP thioesterase
VAATCPVNERPGKASTTRVDHDRAMTVATPATELLPVPVRGRRFEATAHVHLGDVDRHGRLRLDAVARLLQDVAADDADDSGLGAASGWVVRRTLIDVARPAELGERLALTTFCSGTGRSWAERRTSITGVDGASIEACSLWVQIDLDTGRPAPLGPLFEERYGEAAGGRRVSSRLTLPAPPPDAKRRPWPVRVTDLDVFDHVNNAIHWAILEEVLAHPWSAATARRGRGEVEHLAPIELTTPVELVTDAGPTWTSAWLVAAGRASTAARWLPG